MESHRFALIEQYTNERSNNFATIYNGLPRISKPIGGMRQRIIPTESISMAAQLFPVPSAPRPEYLVNTRVDFPTFNRFY